LPQRKPARCAGFPPDPVAPRLARAVLTAQMRRSMSDSGWERSVRNSGSAASAVDVDVSSPSEFQDSFLARVALVSGVRPSAAQPVVERGDRIGGEDGRRFEILDHLGGGAMGLVFAARDALLDRRIAIKFIVQRDGRFQEHLVEMFHREARSAARLDHDNVMRVFDLGTWNGVPFLVMEYLEGTTLAAILRDRRFTLGETTHVMANTVAGLAHAHDRGVVHRDLNPSNVFILKSGGVKVLDFGLARCASSRDAEEFRVSGTPPYMAPEQWLGGTQDARTDIWAAGVMFFELLTGRRPYETRDVVTLKHQIISRDPPPVPRSVRPELPEAADRIAARALQKDPRRRFRTAQEMRAALLAFAASLSRRATRRNLRGRPKRRDAADRDRTRLRERPAHRPLPLADPCAQS
jgi:serine/threonine protein kinase